MNTETRQTNGGSSCSTPEIEGAQQVDSRRCGQKFLQICKSQVCAQAPLGRLEICGISARIVFEATLVFDACLHATLKRSISPIQSLDRKSTRLNSSHAHISYAGF